MKLPRLAPADYLTLPRLLSVPVLWALAWAGSTFWLGIGLALAGLTDVLDGPVARRTGKSSRFGGQLDSAADILLMASIFWWFVLLEPRFFLDNATPLVVWAVIGTVSVLATYIKFGRLGNLHLYSAKTAGVLGYLFAVSLFVLGDYSPVFFGVAVTAAIVAATETLLVALTRRRVDDRVRSILSRPR
ncbi:MAG: CDP-alcohol phosphatidyltransferase family protein [Longimicrobiales bacterium]|nr:CDP-alcohol phosphatidyltransferase family protein [Longimicrobiales bacterium]